MSSDTLVLCPCGEYHPLGFVCEKVQHMEKHSTDKHDHSSHDHKHKHEGSCCSHSHNHHVHEDCQDHIHNHVHEGSCCGHTHEHKHETCCGHEHATPQDIDWKIVDILFSYKDTAFSNTDGIGIENLTMVDDFGKNILRI